MYRKDGQITPIERSKYPKRLLIFDTEAYRAAPINRVEVQTFRIAVTRFIELSDSLEVIDQEYNYYTDPSELVGAIDTYIRKDKTLYVYGHNIKYDLQLSGLLKYLLERKWIIKGFIFEDPPTFIKLSKGRYSIIFIDTFNYWQYSLSKMGEQLDIPKLKMPEDSANPEDWFTYCKRDVEVLSEYLLTFMRYLLNNDLCGLGVTLAAQSFRSYRHKFMTHPIILHNRPEATSLERASYSGGRVEAFRVGVFPKQTYYKLDVNSMYPYVMKDQLYPYEFIAYTEDLPLSKLEQHLNQSYVIAEVTLNTPEPVYPLKHLHKLIFPIGCFTTTLHQSELIHALTHDQITAIHKIAIYRQADLFSDYIDFFYRMKVEAETNHNQVIRQQAKIMMNSLYGKFGQRSVTSKITPNVTDTPYGRITGYSETLNCRVEVNCLGDNMEVSYKQGESAYSFPAIAGAVTANARMYLYRLMTLSGMEHVYYCDTDSLLVDQTGLSSLLPLIHPSDLGKLKVEDQSEDIIIWGAKDYAIGEDIKHKGVPKSAIELKPGVWEYEQFRGAKSWLADGLDPNVEVYTRVKERKSAYDKGIIQPDLTVSPIVFG